jgi:predicted ATP-grasp superfamily ATP-dependent carboligase
MSAGSAQRKALVTGSGNRAFLGVIRSLGRAGIQVHIAGQGAGSEVLRSRYVARAHEVPDYNACPEAWKAALIELMKRERFELVIPTIDPTVIPLQQHRAELEPFGRLYVVNDRAFQVLFDKLQTTALARSQGVPVPREVVLHRPGDSDEVRSAFQLPVVLKPRSSFSEANLANRHRVRIVHDWSDFITYRDELLAYGPVAVQEYFVGEGVGVELLLHEGEPLLAFQHRRLHEPPFGGGSSYRESVPLSPELLEAALRILRPLAYTGVAMVEFRVNPRTGAWVLLAVNGRFWGSLPLSLAAGADFPLALFQLLVDGRTVFPQGYRAGICSRNLSLDLEWFWDNLQARRSDPAHNRRSLPTLALETCVNVLSLRERIDTLTLDDPGPFLSSVRQLLSGWKDRLQWRLARAGRHMDRWLVPYLGQASRRRARRPGEQVHVILCVADHYEPKKRIVSLEEAQRRVARWVEEYPRLFGHFRDSDGRAPRHTFFYPMETYEPEHIDSLAALCRAGFGEVEVHLHHDGDTEWTLREKLLRYKELLSGEHGLLARCRKTGELAYGFIHGNWALCNSRPDGRHCGVNHELEVLRETGCYADFTFPSVPSPTQPRKINSIYYARSDRRRPRSHDWGTDVGAGPAPADALMLIQGPLLLDWGRRKWGLVPRIENGCLQETQPPTEERLALWLKAHVHVPTRPDWVFVKLHTHGAPEENQGVLLGEPMVRLHETLARYAAEDATFHFHYVTAREMYNLARAAEAGWQGSVADARDFELVWNGRGTSELMNHRPEGRAPVLAPR